MRQDQKLGQHDRRYSFFRVLSGQDASTINTYTYIHGFILSPIYSVTKKLISPRKINVVNISTTTITLDYYKYFFKRLISNTETIIFVKNTTTNTWSCILKLGPYVTSNKGGKARRIGKHHPMNIFFWWFLKSLELQLKTRLCALPSCSFVCFNYYLENISKNLKKIFKMWKLY